MNIFFIFLLLVASVKMTRVKRKISPITSSKSCSLLDFKLVEAKFGNESYLLCLKLKSIGASSLASDDSALFVDPNFDEDLEDQNYIQGYPLSKFNMAYGYPFEDPSSGSAEGYIGDDNLFYGVLHLGNRTLFADNYGIDDPNKFFGAFENDDVAVPRRRRDYAQADIERRYLPYQIYNADRNYGTARSRICDLLLLADKEFFENDANSSLSNAVRRMIHAVAQADIIFRNADFNEDGVPDNIGFSVKSILVLTSKATNTRVFGNLLDSHAIDGREYLLKFARLRRLSEVCLGVAFSGHAFHNRTLGLSFTSLGGGFGGAAGGLCDRRAYGQSFNILAIAHATTEDSYRVPERIAALTLAHEMGHSFGAHHDDNFPNPECRGHLMSAQSSTADNRKYFEFSLCSKRLIASTLNSMSYCFTEEDKPYCGNGIVEDGEACDCGLPSRCHNKDPCCTPRAGSAHFFEECTVHKDGCSVAPSAKCHPSQGICCLSNCQYANLSKSGIDCKMQYQKCKCDNMTVSCRCGLDGRCKDDGSCHAAECALLGLDECQCIRSPGGVIGERYMCGICCETKGQRTDCVSVEAAAKEYMKNRSLPAEWPGLNSYVGPNVTIRFCKNVKDECRSVTLRAWPYESPCVSRGSVGLCTTRGVCARMLQTPRSNLYPDLMGVLAHKKIDVVKLKSTANMRVKSSAKRTIVTLILLFISFMLHLF